MGNSLFEQMKKAGLVDKSQADKVRKEKRQKTKQQHKQQSKKQAQQKSAAAQLAEQARQEKQQRDRDLNAERKRQADSKALAAQIKQIIESNRQDKGVEADSDEGVSYNFVQDNKVKSIFVSEKIQQQLACGRLAIVEYESRYELIPKVVAEKISAREPGWFVSVNETVEVDDEDDPYKDYKIPDDLMW